MARSYGHPYQTAFDDICIVTFQGKGAERELVVAGWLPRGPVTPAPPAQRRPPTPTQAPTNGALLARLLGAL